MSNRESESRFELMPDAKVHAVASLDDAGGKRHFLKSETGQYFYLDQGLEKYEEVNEDTVLSSIAKHGYKAEHGEMFEFGKRQEFLK